MLDACPHHHEEDASAALSNAAEHALEGINLRAPGASKTTGKKLWRSLDELAGTKSFETMLHREFPHAASEWNDGPSRRNFLKLMSASLALAGLSACTLRKTEEKIVPYVNPPEVLIPGRPLFFASTMPWMGYGKGVVVESHEGRPTKIEGNVDHPASLGSSDIWMQASVLELYDPDRSQQVKFGNIDSTWGKFTEVMKDEFGRVKENKGKGLRFLTGTITSPTVVRQKKQLQAIYPEARWHMHEAVGRPNARAGAEMAFGTDVDSVYNFEEADVVVSLDCNFLTELPGSLPYSRDFISRRRIRQGKPAEMNRLYMAETSLSVTGAQADHRLAIKSSEIQALAADILAALSGQAITGKNSKWASVVARDLQASAGKSLVVVGETQPADVHAIAHSINAKLGNIGKTVTYIEPIEEPGESLESLVSDLKNDAVDLLVIIGTNPAYTAPREFGFSEGLSSDPKVANDERTAAYKLKNPLSKARLVIHHGLYAGQNDETATFAQWHVPASHYLESWGDLRAFDGTPSISQPLIYPMYNSKSEIELLAFMAGEGARQAYDILRETWTEGGPKLSDDDWQRTLEKGVVAGKQAFAPKNVSIKSYTAAAPEVSSKIEIVFRQDPSILDGRYANCGWLQELPKPISLLTWENVALMSVQTAANLQISQADQGKGVEVPLLSLDVGGKTVKEIPALIMPGHAEDSITVYLGYGRSRCGRVGSQGIAIGYEDLLPGPLGADVYPIKPASNVWFAPNCVVTPLDKMTKVATSQSHHLIDLPSKEKDAKEFNKLDQNWIEGRELIQKFNLEEVKNGDNEHRKVTGPRTVSLTLAKEEIPDNQKLLPAWNYDYNKWGMVIDNQSCIGCNACVIACQSENNIAIVGKQEVLRGREMHWIRIDTYFIGEPDGTVEVFNQPIPCMQCENAPCALVCPVEATTTSAEGINEQTYNRCVGTRYCSNNCPYKVRRFNFLQFTDYDTPQFMLQRNPNVTVRSRGVMEKCNFCVQRVNNARIEAKKQDRPIYENEAQTACAQSCPTQAITFGNLNDPSQQVTALQKEPLRYTLLDELNALPRVSYLSRVKNPNPELASV